MVRIRKQILILGFLSLIFNSEILFAQTEKEVDLKSSLKSFKALGDALIKGDSVTILGVVTKEGFQAVKTHMLYLLGEKWLALLEQNKVEIFHNSKKLQILKVGNENYLLGFVLEGTDQWKFYSFIERQ